MNLSPAGRATEQPISVRAGEGGGVAARGWKKDNEEEQRGSADATKLHSWARKKVKQRWKTPSGDFLSRGSTPHKHPPGALLKTEAWSEAQGLLSGSR